MTSISKKVEDIDTELVQALKEFNCNRPRGAVTSDITAWNNLSADDRKKRIRAFVRSNKKTEVFSPRIETSAYFTCGPLISHLVLHHVSKNGEVDIQTGIILPAKEFHF